MSKQYVQRRKGKLSYGGCETQGESFHGCFSDCAIDEFVIIYIHTSN